MKLITTLAVLCAFTTTVLGDPPREIKPNTLGTGTGRYVCGQLGTARADQYLLDTETGRIWQFAITTNGATVLQPVLYSTLYGVSTLTPDTPDHEVATAQAIRKQVQEDMKARGEAQKAEAAKRQE